MPIEAEILDDARKLAAAARTPVKGVSQVEVEQRAQGDFLRKLVERLQPMLRQSMRSHRIFLASDPYGAVELKSNGIFVHVDNADQQDALVPVQVLSTEPNLLTILNRIEAELAAADDARATAAAMIVRHARNALEVELGGT